MHNEQAFLDAIAANPKDDGTRLIYADWLEERGALDRAEYLRCEAQLFAEPPESPGHPALIARVHRLSRRLHRRWLRAVARQYGRSTILQSNARGCCTWCADPGAVTEGLLVEWVAGMYNKFVCRQHHPILITAERIMEEQERREEDIESEEHADRLLGEELSELGLTRESFGEAVTGPDQGEAVFRRSPVLRKLALYWRERG